jgi:hypothetical protein
LPSLPRDTRTSVYYQDLGHLYAAKMATYSPLLMKTTWVPIQIELFESTLELHGLSKENVLVLLTTIVPLTGVFAQRGILLWLDALLTL